MVVVVLKMVVVMMVVMGIMVFVDGAGKSGVNVNQVGDYRCGSGGGVGNGCSNGGSSGDDDDSGWTGEERWKY